MAINATSVYRARSTGNNANGAGFDAGISGALSTTLSGAYTAGSGTLSVTSATGWPSSGNYYCRVGNVGGETFSSGATGSSQVLLVTAGQGTTTWTVTAAQLGTTDQNFASGTVVDNDKTRANTAEASGSVGTSTASTTFVDATAAFDLTCVGNSIYITSGTGATVGLYFIQSRTNATTVVLDRASGTYTAGVWKMGGGWTADFRTQISSTWFKPGNTLYFRASGSGSKASPDYTWADKLDNVVTGDTTGGRIWFISENGRAWITATKGCLVANNAFLGGVNLNVVAGGTNYAGSFSLWDCFSGYGNILSGVILDQNGKDLGALKLNGVAENCEIWSSTANAGADGTNFAVTSNNETYPCVMVGCNIHDTWGGGVTSAQLRMIGNIIARCRGDGVSLTYGGNIGSSGHVLENNTFDANHGNGLVFQNAQAFSPSTVIGNIFSNHTTAAKYGVAANFNSTAVNDLMRGFIDCNAYYNNTANAQNFTIGTGVVNGMQLHDVVGTDPQYTDATNENYTIGANLKAKGYPQVAYTNSKASAVAPTSYVDSGGVQRQETGGSGGTAAPAFFWGYKF